MRRFMAMAFVCLLLLVTWQDLRCLLLITYNYCYWPIYHRSFQYIEIREKAGRTANLNVSRVPKILHQSWKTTEIPVAWKVAQHSCIKMHKDDGYEYRLWTDADAEELIESKYPWFISTYRSYLYDIQRADSARYFILHQFGGIYLDLDIYCLSSLDYLRGSAGGFVVPKTHPIGVSNDLLVSPPGHPFTLRLIRNLDQWARGFFFLKYTTVMFSTGPMFVTIQAALHSNKSEIDVLSSQLYGKYHKGKSKDSSRALIGHLKGSSWHGEDAKMFLFLSRNGLRLSQFLICLMVLLAAVAWLWLFRRYCDGHIRPLGGGTKEV
jgi:mannosyltransferase OCH1-like enzyme